MRKSLIAIVTLFIAHSSRPRSPPEPERSQPKSLSF